METHVGCQNVNYFLHFDVVNIHEQQKKIGTMIRYLRRSRMPEMTIEELAERSGLTRQTVGDIERGKKKNVGAITLKSIALALEVSIDALMSNVIDPMMAETEQEYGQSSHLPDRKKASTESRMAHPKRRAS